MDVWAVLSTLASIAASLVGFSGLLTAFRASSADLTPYDINNIRTLLIYSVSALVFALLPLPLATRQNGEVWSWLTVALGASLLFWSLQSPRWMRKKGLKPRLPVLYFGVLGVQALLGAGLVAGALLLADSSALYALGVLWFLIVALLVFVVQVFLLLPIDAPRSGD